MTRNTSIGDSSCQLSGQAHAATLSYARLRHTAITSSDKVTLGPVNGVQLRHDLTKRFTYFLSSFIQNLAGKIKQ